MVFKKISLAFLYTCVRSILRISVRLKTIKTGFRRPLIIKRTSILASSLAEKSKETKEAMKKTMQEQENLNLRKEAQNFNFVMEKDTKLEFLPMRFEEPPSDVFDAVVERITQTLQVDPLFKNVKDIDLTLIDLNGTPRLKGSRLSVSFLLTTYVLNGMTEFTRTLQTPRMKSQIFDSDSFANLYRVL